MSLATLLLELALLCVLAAVPVIGYMFYLYFRIGRLIKGASPALWNEMKPGMYSDFRVSQQHDRRFKDFISNREYLELGIPRLERLVRHFKIAKMCSVVVVTVSPVAALCGLILLQ